MPEEQQKMMLHLCGCFIYVCVCVCLEAPKYTELCSFQDYFYIRSAPREDISDKLLEPGHRPVTGCCCVSVRNK